MSAPLARISKDPVAKKPYIIDLTDFLDPGDVISSVDWVVPAPLVKSGEELVNGATATKVWLEGGTVDEIYVVTCKITTVGGLVDKRTLEIEMVDE